MKYRFFHVPALDPAAETEVLNRFLAERRIVAVDRQFVADGGNSFWVLSVAYRDGASALDPTGVAGRPEKTKIDYREVFDERDFATFVALRTLRKALVETEGVPGSPTNNWRPWYAARRAPSRIWPPSRASARAGWRSTPPLS